MPDNLDAHDNESLQDILESYKHVFIVQSGGCTSLRAHRIATGTHQPVRRKLCLVSTEKWEILDQCIGGLLDRDLVEQSSSPWASVPVLTRKQEAIITSL